MSRIGRIFVVKSLKIEKIKILQKAYGEYERLNLASYLFLCRQFRGKKRGIEKVTVSCLKIDGTVAIELRALPGEDEFFSKFYRGIQRYVEERLANFFIWMRSSKEKIRKVPYEKVWSFTRDNGDGKSVLIPVGSELKPGSYYPGALSQTGYFSLCMWVPHEEDEGFIKIEPYCYPAQEDWARQHDVYLEWTEQYDLPTPQVFSERSDIIKEIILELGPDFEKEIERTKVVLRHKLREEFSPRYSLLLEMLSDSLGEWAPASVEEKLRALSLGIF